MSFTYEEAHSLGGIRILAILTEELETLRMENDNTQLDERQTWLLRGRIKQIKNLIEITTYVTPAHEIF